jgi:hypothetical protein
MLTKKQGRGHPVPDQKFCNSSLPACQPCARARTAATPIPSIVYFTILWMPGGWGHALPSGTAIPGPRSLAFHGSRNTDHRPRPIGPQVPLRRNTQSARITGVTAWWQPGNISAPPVSKILRADIGSAMLERRPGRKSIPERRAGVARARRPGSNVLTKRFDVDLLAGWSGQASNRAGKAGSVRMGQRPFLGPR